MARIATFFSHFGAERFRRLCQARGVEVELMPVPRSLSSSCGTCARFEGDPLAPGEGWPEEVELVVEESGAATLPSEVPWRAEGVWRRQTRTQRGVRPGGGRPN